MKGILACEKNGGIGKDGSMPWPHDKKDLVRFKELTLNKTILMGRGTWEASGMPKPLPHRQNIVVSSQKLTLPEDVILLDNTNYKTLIIDFKVDWVIGGANLFNSLIHMLDEIHLSHLHKSYDCDRHIDLDDINTNFDLESETVCLTHIYKVFKRKKKWKEFNA